MIIRDYVLPNGTVATVHRLVRAVSGDDLIMLTVNSFADEKADMVAWQDAYLAPLEVMTNYPAGAVEWLISPMGPFAGGTVLADPDALDVIKSRAKAEIARRRDAVIAGGANTPVGRVDTDEVSIRNILGAYQSAVAAMMANQPLAMNWRMADNTTVALEAAGVIAMGNAVLTHTQDAYARSWALKDAVEAATSDLEVIGVDLSTGWPS